MRMIGRFTKPQRRSATAFVLSVLLGAVTLTDATKGHPANPDPVTEGEEKIAEPRQQATEYGLRVRVVDSEGAPIQGAEVECQGFDWRKTTDASGWVSWRGLKRSYAFVIKKAGFKHRFVGTLKPGEEHLIALERATTIHGKVLDRETRERVAHFEVYHARLLDGPTIPSVSGDEPIKGSAGEFEYSFPHFVWSDSALYIYAEGYATLVSRALTLDDDGTEMTFELTTARRLTGKVLTPSGTPARNAEVRLWFGESDLRFTLPHHRVNTDKQGAFAIPPENGGELIIAHDSGYLEVPLRSFRENEALRLSEWGHIKGRLPFPLPAEGRLYIHRMNWTGQHLTFRPNWVNSPAKLDREGTFQFEDPVPPGEYELSLGLLVPIQRPGGGTSLMFAFSKLATTDVQSGRTSFIEVPAGRTVVGKIEFKNQAAVTNRNKLLVELRSYSPGPDFPFPGNILGKTRPEEMEEYRNQVLSYWLSDEGKARRRSERQYKTALEGDGTFRLPHVQPGDYVISAGENLVLDSPSPQVGAEVRVPNDLTTNVVDLGVVRVKAW